MALEVVVGKEATIQCGAHKRIHSRNRVLSRPDVFVPNVVVETCLCRCGHSQNKPYCDGSHTATENRAA